MARTPRLSIRPSALGGKGLLLFATLELAFLATSYSNLFFLLLAFCAVLGALGSWWALGNLRSVRIAALQVEAGGTGTARTLRVRLTGGQRGHFDLAIELPLAGRHCEVAHVAWAAKETVISGTLPPQPRGIVALEHVRVTSRFPFGFVIARLDVPLTHELVTHPEPTQHSANGRTAGQASDAGVASLGRGTALAGVREFRSGDALADVHWKATARRGTAVVKERERETEPAMEVVLDRRCGSDELEAALCHVTALVLAARHRQPLQIHSQGVELHVDPERGGTAEALRWLAGTQPLSADGPPPPERRFAVCLPTLANQSASRNGP